MPIRKLSLHRKLPRDMKPKKQAIIYTILADGQPVAALEATGVENPRAADL
jgi:hypothetical protein